MRRYTIICDGCGKDAWDSGRTMVLQVTTRLHPLKLPDTADVEVFPSAHLCSLNCALTLLHKLQNPTSSDCEEPGCDYPAGVSASIGGKALNRCFSCHCKAVNETPQ